MADERNGRSGMELAADTARAVKAAIKVAKAAAVAGPEGAAIAAVKEALPFLCKLVIGLVVGLLALTMLVFTAIPNMFFGYGSSQKEPIVALTTKAMTLGGTYVNLEDFVAAQVDAIVTSLVAEYEAAGTHIDEIRVEHSFTEEDLIWVIAINSAAYRQDLNTLTPENIRQFVTAHLTYNHSLFGREKVILHVKFKKLDPKELMAELGFDAEGERWAGTFQETLTNSDALSKYEPYFNEYRPNYSGDTTVPGNAQHGGNYSNDIDISRFVSPHTKNNHDLAAYAIQAWENNWGYVWGTYGNVLTESLLQYKLEQYPDGVGNHEAFIRANWLGRRTTDCIGLIKGYGWLDVDSMKIKYNTNGMPDYGANSMHQAAINAGTEGEDYGPISSLPEIPGLALWKNGHIGVYIGGGYAIEASGTRTGVVKTKVEGRGWAEWCKIPYINYRKGG